MRDDKERERQEKMLNLKAPGEFRVPQNDNKVPEMVFDKTSEEESDG